MTLDDLIQSTLVADQKQSTNYKTIKGLVSHASQILLRITLSQNKTDGKVMEGKTDEINSLLILR